MNLQSYDLLGPQPDVNVKIIRIIFFFEIFLFLIFYLFSAFRDTGATRKNVVDTLGTRVPSAPGKDAKKLGHW